MTDKVKEVDSSISTITDKPFKNLTVRETECLCYLIRGNTAKETARRMALSPKTVEYYISNIKIKWTCYSKADIIEKAVNEGFIDIIPKWLLAK